jgi:oligopeptide transport system substrate-binding protein
MSCFRRACLFVCALGWLAAAGCSDKTPTASTASSPSSAAPKILRVGNGTEPQDLDPHVVTGVPEHKIITALFEGLVTYAADGGIAPGVAQYWDISDDGLVYTFHLRDTAKWSNGEPITSEDFVRSFQRILTPSLGAEYAYKLFPLVGAEDFNRGKLTDFSKVGATAVDALTLRLTLTNPTPFLLESLNHYAWFPVHLPTVEKFGGADRKGTAWTRPGNMVSNGPFNLVSWKPNQVITVTKSPTYWDHDNVKLDGIEFYAIDNADSEERLFRTGGLDYCYSLPLSKIETYRREHADTYRATPYYGVYYYRLNVTKKPLDDQRIRRALALAIDRESIVKNILRDAGQTPAYNFTPPSAKFTSTARLSGDLAEARRLLAEAGYPDGKDLPPVEILFNTSDSHRVIAEAIQQMWKTRLGVNATITNQEWKVFLDTNRTLNYQISRAGWIGDYDDPHTFLELWVTGGGNNQTGWSNADYDRLLRTALETRTEADRMAVYQKLDAILADEVPVIPIYFYTRVYAISPKVKNWITTPLDNRGWKWIDLAE